MGIIAELERGPRGLYTGSIGFIEPDGDAAFNVAIRTLVFAHNALQERDLQDRPACATLGLGFGIVADSRAAAEWRECLDKGEFVGAAGDRFDIIEKMPLQPAGGVQ